jgi:hypothetical protein
VADLLVEHGVAARLAMYAGLDQALPRYGTRAATFLTLGRWSSRPAS